VERSFGITWFPIKQKESIWNANSEGHVLALAWM